MLLEPQHLPGFLWRGYAEAQVADESGEPLDEFGVGLGDLARGPPASVAAIVSWATSSGLSGFFTPSTASAATGATEMMTFRIAVSSRLARCARSEFNLRDVL